MRHLIFLAALICLGTSAWADSEYKVTTDKGSYIATSVVTGSSVTGTALLAANPKRVDATIFDIDSAAIYIGTTSSTIQVNHSNLTLGFPVTSSTTFRFDGSMTSAIYFTCQGGNASCRAAVMENLNR